MAIIVNGQPVDPATTRVRTTDATQTTLWSRAVPANTTLRLRATVTAVRSDGAARATYEREASVYRGAGNVALHGDPAVPAPDQEDVAGWEATFDVDTTTQTVRLRVTGAGATTLDWHADVQVHAA